MKDTLTKQLQQLQKRTLNTERVCMPNIGNKKRKPSPLLAGTLEYSGEEVRRRGERRAGDGELHHLLVRRLLRGQRQRRPRKRSRHRAVLLQPTTWKVGETHTIPTRSLEMTTQFDFQIHCGDLP